MKYLASVLVILALLLPPFTFQASASGIPTFSIVSVEADKTVTIQTYNFPAHRSFVVRMGAYGTRAIGGVKLTTTDSGAGGSFKVTYDIPDQFKGDYRIAIRMDATSGGYYAYNWFYNNTTGGGGSSQPPSGYSGTPTFSIHAVVRDKTVTIRTNNFPAHYTFTVRIGEYGTKAIGGIKVGTTGSGTGGIFEATYKIPTEFKGATRIAIRMDSTKGGFYAYNWFYNRTTNGDGTPSEPPSGYSGIPTFSIVAVVRNKTVTIKTNNFPAHQSFTVRMGAYGTKGVGGYKVDTTDSGAGGVFEKTYNIPAELKGSYRVAIRLESTAGYYAYNWFYNNTYP